METTFTPIMAAAGGILVGLAAVLLLLADGRIAGISGIIGGLLAPQAGDVGWRVAFLAGLLLAPILWRASAGEAPPVTVTPSPTLLVIGGLPVGYGARLGSGCTSGHGVCGLARLSPRSIVATAVFLASAIATVFVTRHLIGG